MKTGRNPQKEFEEMLTAYPALVEPSIKALTEYISRKDKPLAESGDLPASQVGKMLNALMHECFTKHTKKLLASL